LKKKLKDEYPKLKLFKVLITYFKSDEKSRIISGVLHFLKDVLVLPRDGAINGFGESKAFPPPKKKKKKKKKIKILPLTFLFLFLILPIKFQILAPPFC
jgi:hypothetical protein